MTPEILDIDYFLQRASEISKEDLMREMKDSGLNQIDTILVLRKALKMDISAAKLVVHQSETWQELQSLTEKLHKEAEDLLEEYKTDSSKDQG